MPEKIRNIGWHLELREEDEPIIETNEYGPRSLAGLRAEFRLYRIMDDMRERQPSSPESRDIRYDEVLTKRAFGKLIDGRLETFSDADKKHLQVERHITPEQVEQGDWYKVTVGVSVPAADGSLALDREAEVEYYVRAIAVPLEVAIPNFAKDYPGVIKLTPEMSVGAGTMQTPFGGAGVVDREGVRRVPRTGSRGSGRGGAVTDETKVIPFPQERAPRRKKREWYNTTPGRLLIAAGAGVSALVGAKALANKLNSMRDQATQDALANNPPAESGGNIEHATATATNRPPTRTPTITSTPAPSPTPSSTPSHTPEPSLTPTPFDPFANSDQFVDIQPQLQSGMRSLRQVPPEVQQNLTDVSPGAIATDTGLLTLVSLERESYNSGIIYFGFRIDNRPYVARANYCTSQYVNPVNVNEHVDGEEFGTSIIFFEDVANRDRLIDFMPSSCADLIGGLRETSLQELQDFFSEGIWDGQDASGAVVDLSEYAYVTQVVKQSP